MTTTDTGIIASPASRAQAVRALELALTRWERMASPPRYLQYPLVGDFMATARAAANAFQAGNLRRAAELNELCDREGSRVLVLLAWRNGQVHRGLVAWRALVQRLERAIDWAERTGVIVGQGPHDILDDARAQVRHLEVREYLDTLA